MGSYAAEMNSMAPVSPLSDVHLPPGLAGSLRMCPPPSLSTMSDELIGSQ